MAKSKTFRDLAKNAGMSGPDIDRLFGTMDAIGDVLNGRRERPGGIGCTFPHCSCNSPWEKCERKKSPPRSAFRG